MKSWKNLLVPVAIIVALIIGLIVFRAVSGKDKDTKATETDATSTNLFSYTSDEISKIHVAKKDGTGYSVSLVSAATQAQTDSSLIGVTDSTDESTATSAVWAYNEDGSEDTAYNFSQTNIATFISVMSTFQIIDQVTEGTDTFAEYGLDDPTYTVEYTLTDGTTFTIYIGDLTYDSLYVYFTLDDSGIVYTTYQVKSTKCDSSMIDFIDLSILSVDQEDVKTFSFVRSGEGISFSADAVTTRSADGSSTEFGWQFTKPFTIEASAFFTNLVDSFIDLSAVSYVEIGSDIDYSQYGLDNPAYIITIELTTGKIVTISLSEAVDGSYYCASSNAPGVFTIATSQITGMQTPISDLIHPYLDYQFIYDVTKIDATFPEGSFSMDIDIATGGQIVDDASTVLINGRNAKVYNNDGRSYFALLYESVMLIQITDFDFDVTPENTHDITIDVTTTDGLTKKIELAKRDDSTYYAFIDGIYQGFIVNASELYQNNGSDMTIYGAWPAYLRLIEALDGATLGIYQISNS